MSVVAVKYNKLADTPAFIRRDAARKLRALTNHTLETAKADCPVDSGALRDSHQAEVDESALTARITAGGDTAPYADKVHNGTSRMPPRPWLLNAVTRDRPAYDELLHAVAAASFTGGG